MKRKNLGGAKRQHGEERTVAAAAGAFLVICGALLFFGGFADCDGTAASERPAADTRKEDAARDALRHAEAAERAFTTENYGDARRHIRAVRQRLADSLEGGEARNE